MSVRYVWDKQSFLHALGQAGAQKGVSTKLESYSDKHLETSVSRKNFILDVSLGSEYTYENASVKKNQSLTVF